MESILYLEQIAFAFMVIFALCVVYLLVKNIKLCRQKNDVQSSALNEFVYVIMWFASIVNSLYFLPQFGMWPGKLETVFVGTIIVPWLVNCILRCLVAGSIFIYAKSHKLLSLEEKAAN